jgi:hypothetical protein
MRHDRRSPITGRFEHIPTENTPLARDSHFETMRDLEAHAQGADPADLAYRTVGRAESAAGERYAAPKVQDDLAVGGSRLRHRRPEIVSEQDAEHTIYGKQGAVLRSAAGAGHGDMDPSSYLVSGDDAR